MPHLVSVWANAELIAYPGMGRGSGQHTEQLLQGAGKQRRQNRPPQLSVPSLQQSSSSWTPDQGPVSKSCCCMAHAQPQPANPQHALPLTPCSSSKHRGTLNSALRLGMCLWDGSMLHVSGWLSSAVGCVLLVCWLVLPVLIERWLGLRHALHVHCAVGSSG